jgi:hypothetical protein
MDSFMSDDCHMITEHISEIVPLGMQLEKSGVR